MKPSNPIKPLVSIVTVNYNETAATCDLLGSLAKITYPNIEVIVVDNYSGANDLSEIRAMFKRAIIVESPINYGFAAGSNYGIMKASGKYVLLLNNDTVVQPSFLEPLVEFMEASPDVGVVSPLIKLYQNPKIIQFAGATPIHWLTSRNKIIGAGQTDLGQFTMATLSAFGHGAAMMIPMEVIRKAGLMSYAYFLYYEEADWCRRIMNEGFKIYTIPASVVFHKISLTTGKNLSEKVYYLNRGRFIYILRNSKGLSLFLSALYQLFIAIPKNVITYSLKEGSSSMQAYVKAVAWTIKNFNKTELYENPRL